MALVKCPDCGGQLSTEAIACPHCGRPNRPVVVNGDSSGQAAVVHPAANPATGQPRPAPEQALPPSNAGQVASPEMPSVKRCSACGKEIKPGATRCGHCFQAIPSTPGVTAAIPPSPVNSPTLRPCKRCQKLVPIDTATCPHCGELSKKETTKILGLLALFLIAVGIAVAMGKSNYSPNSATSETRAQPAPSVPSVTPIPLTARPQPPTERLPQTGQVTAIQINAAQLHREYEDNEVAADVKYKGQVLLVDGSINSIEKDMFDHIVLYLRTGDDFNKVMATLEDAEAGKAAALKRRQSVVLLCIGGMRIMGSASLSGCRIR
jgi:RNA polymerase subunit RPABC4/transcription elongation factor Spt4